MPFDNFAAILKAAPCTGPTVQVHFDRENRQDYQIEKWNDPYVQTLWTRYRIDRIEVRVWDGGAWKTARSYDLSYKYHWKQGSSTEGHSLLTKVTERGEDGGALPATEFTYYESPQDYINHIRLESADNGEGGEYTYSYEDESVSMSCKHDSKRFVVSKVERRDGISGHTGITDYTYVSPDAETDADCRQYEFLGHGVVQGVDEDSSGTGVRERRDTYYQREDGDPDPRKGKISDSKVKQLPGEETLFERQNDYEYNEVHGQPFVHLDETKWEKHASPWQRTLYFYEEDHQGGAQYGNWTRKEEYTKDGSSAEKLVRVTHRWFYPRVSSTRYIVDRVAKTELDGSDGACKGLTRYFYDNSWYTVPPLEGLLTDVWVAIGSTCGSGWSKTKYEYDGWGNRTKVTDPDGHATTTQYDSLYHAYPTEVTNAKGHTIEYAWNWVLGAVEKVTDPNGAVTEYEYDQWGRLRKVWKPGEEKSRGDSPTEEYLYTEYSGSSSPYRVEHKVRTDLGGSSSAVYLGEWIFYDGFGRVVETQRELGDNQAQTVTTRYDVLGRVKEKTVPYSSGMGAYADGAGKPATSYAYNALDEVETVTHTDGTSVHTFYTGLRTAVVDERLHQVVTKEDGLGRLLFTRQYTTTLGSPEPDWDASVYAKSTYTYDEADRLSRVVVSKGEKSDPITTTIGYDVGGRKTSMTDPDMGQWSYAYDAAGNLTRQTDARGRVTCYVYDELNRVRWVYEDTTEPKDCQDGLTWLYTNEYDSTDSSSGAGIGRRTEQRGPFGKHHWKYDARGRVVQEVDTINGAGTYTTGWEYDAADRVYTMTYPSEPSGEGETLHYYYDSAGLLDRVLGSYTTYVDSTTYDEAGRVTERILGSRNGKGVVDEHYSYYGWGDLNGRGRLKEIRAKTGDGSSDYYFSSYAYDAAGNVVSIIESTSGQTLQFEYDALNRLDHAEASDSNGEVYAKEYEYAHNGNLTSKTGVGNYAYDAIVHGCSAGTGLTKPHAVASAGSNTYEYDCNGNQIERKIGEDTYDLTYDAMNHLTEVKRNGQVKATFVYDGDGNRVESVVNGSTTVHVGKYYEKTVGSGYTRYYYAGGGLVSFERSSGYGSSGYGLRYVVRDHLGSTSVIVNGRGVKLWEDRYYPFGDIRYTYRKDGDPSFPLQTRYRYTGQWFNEGVGAEPEGGLDRGLYYYGARWYDPTLGRFVQPDTVVPRPGNPQSLNRYSYVRNNPLRYTDPSGHMFDECGQGSMDCGGDGDHPVSGKPVPGNRIALWLIYNEMLSHAQSAVVKDIHTRVQASNETLSGCIPMSTAFPFTCVTSISNRKVAYEQWQSMVGTGAPWDQKEKIRRNFGGGYSAYHEGYKYRFDIWSNIHYGYVGRAAGFTRRELLAGAGYAQITAHTSDLHYWSTYFDDPYDQIAIEIGMDLYDEYQLNVNIEKFWQVFDRYAAELPRLKDTVSGGE